jgi:hypothetical protein
MSKFFTTEFSQFVYELIDGLVIEHSPFTNPRITTIEHLVILDAKQIMAN